MTLMVQSFTASHTTLGREIPDGRMPVAKMNVYFGSPPQKNGMVLVVTGILAGGAPQ